MNCPICNVPLARRQYEAVAVSMCGKCHGCLVDAHRLEGIQRNQAMPRGELRAEADREFQQDTADVVRCPKCKRKMAKRRTPPPACIYVDSCDTCKLVWLDGGELAILQLAYESTDKAVEMQRFRDRYARMSPARKAELRRRLESLPASEDDPLSIFGSGIAQGLFSDRWEPLGEML